MKIPQRTKYFLLVIIAIAGFFMGERIYEDRELKTNTPTIFILTEDPVKNENPENGIQNIATNILEGTKEVTQDILTGTNKVRADLQEDLTPEPKI